MGRERKKEHVHFYVLTILTYMQGHSPFKNLRNCSLIFTKLRSTTVALYIRHYITKHLWFLIKFTTITIFITTTSFEKEIYTQCKVLPQQLWYIVADKKSYSATNVSPYNAATNKKYGTKSYKFHNYFTPKYLHY